MSNNTAFAHFDSLLGFTFRPEIGNKITQMKSFTSGKTANGTEDLSGRARIFGDPLPDVKTFERNARNRY